MPRKRPSSRGSARAHAARGRLTTGGWVAVVTTILVICSSLTAYGAYYNIYGKLSQQQVDTDAFGDRPTKVKGAMNIMIIGSDVRTGKNGNYGEAEGERPDSLIIAHISPNEGRATMVNLPRDSIVDLPSCPPKGDKPGMDAHQGMINSAMSYGGVQCQWKTVEQLTGVHIDHFVSVDFTGFKDIVDSIGGVKMCVPEAIDDKKAKLHLKAGEQVLNGEESLGYMRSRYGQGDGSDVSRISRQQDFLGAMLKEVTSGEILSSPTNLYDFLGSVAQTITTDDEFTVNRMADIAIAMRNVDMKDIKFITVPNGPAPSDPNRLAWKEPAASELFEAVAQDQPIGGKDDKGGEKKQDKAKPEEVSVEVINGTGVPGLADDVSTVLSSKGFQVAGTGNPQGQVPSKTTVYYGSGQKAKAEAVADKSVNATVEEKASLGDTVQLVMASDWDGFTTSGGGSDVPDSVKSKSAAESEVKCE